MNGKERGTVPPDFFGSSSDEDDNMVEDLKRNVRAGTKAVDDGTYK